MRHSRNSVQYEILVHNRDHDKVIIPYAVVSHLGVDVLLKGICDADEEDRRLFFNTLIHERRNRFISKRNSFVLAAVTLDKDNVPLSLSPEDFFSYEDEHDCVI